MNTISYTMLSKMNGCVIYSATCEKGGGRKGYFLPRHDPKQSMPTSNLDGPLARVRSLAI
jgi:hypothetical protein